MSIQGRFRCSLYICFLEKNQATNIELNFSKDYFLINFLEAIKNENHEKIGKIFSPFFTNNSKMQLKINFIYIKNIYLDSKNLLKFTIHNPLSQGIATFIFTNFKQKIAILPEMNLSTKTLSKLSINVSNKIIQITKTKIMDFKNVIYLLYQFIGTERKYQEIIEQYFVKAFIFGMKYFQIALNDFQKTTEKNEQYMNKEIANKINGYISEIKVNREKEKKRNIMEHIKDIHKSSSSIEDNDEEKEEENSKNNNMEEIDKILVNNGIENNEYKPEIIQILEIDSNKRRDLFQNYSKISRFLPEIKTNVSYFTEITVNLFFTLMNIDKNELSINLAQYKSSTNQDPDNINDIPESMFKMNTRYIPKDDSYKYNYPLHTSYNVENKCNENLVNELLDFSKKFNSFLPNNSHDNIIENASQIIHRKFFEFFFRDYFSDIINIEVEKNKIMSIDNLNLILRMISRLKKILFINKNKDFFIEYPCLNS